MKGDLQMIIKDIKDFITKIYIPQIISIHHIRKITKTARKRKNIKLLSALINSSIKTFHTLDECIRDCNKWIKHKDISNHILYWKLSRLSFYYYSRKYIKLLYKLETIRFNIACENVKGGNKK